MKQNEPTPCSTSPHPLGLLDNPVRAFSKTSMIETSRGMKSPYFILIRPLGFGSVKYTPVLVRKFSHRPQHFVVLVKGW